MRGFLGCLLVAGLFCPSTFGQDQDSAQADGKTKDGQAAKRPVSAPPKVLEKAPEKFRVKFETSKGDVIIEVTRKWAPLGADQFYNLVKTGYFDGNRFFRVVPGFVIQWGLSGDPQATANWKKPLKDDPVVASNLRGYVSFATAGPNTRTTQLFINLADNRRLDSMGFAPFGKVVKGMDVLEKLYSGYGEQVTPQQGRIKQQGNKFLQENYPKLDYIRRAVILKDASDAKKAPGAAGQD